ncbi:helix-turn-helix domain-containing protein [Bradyrhizobium sp. CSA207]|uniref:helix-turn-helix transcriptional regulator n=1 Tax=Bradyrhizobium sp. CSA207 TaxID=2698826 RepID=UPI0023AEB25B|nr:helix-turn-helix domain-containing protein [Bradyrhizobium sp. CSA207]MDE5441185.1 helix-turn-helix domain-containing protein [Bradyrhizobium sp. CSA207]
MHFQRGLAPISAVSVFSAHREPGPQILLPIGMHRIIVHLSAATRSFCRESGYAALREAGDIDLIPSGATGGFDAESAYDSLEIRLSPAMLDQVAAEARRARPVEKFDVRHQLRNERIVHLANALAAEIRAGSPSGDLYADSVGTALAIQLLGMTDHEPLRSGRLSSQQLKRVLDFIDGHLDHPLTLDRLSREAGVSSSHLRTWFKVATGMTVHRYVLRRRLERARFLILNRDLRTSEVALEAGFAHQSHLSRWMRREFGHTPGDLRRMRGSG